MKQIIRHLKHSTVLSLDKEVEYQPGQIVSKTLVQNKSLSLTLFAFDANEEISSHESSGDALITIFEGSAEVTIGADKYQLNTNESIVMPAKVSHAVYALSPFKMLLTVVF